MPFQKGNTYGDIYKDITGQRFGWLTAIKPIGTNKNRKKIWLFQCDCGELSRAIAYDVSHSGTRSCGCRKLKASKENSYKHGQRGTRLHNIWRDIQRRCYKKQRPGFKNYGGRGVKMHKLWKADFANFYDWSMENGYKDDLCLARNGDMGNYEPGNCRWISKSENTKEFHINTKTKYLRLGFILGYLQAKAEMKQLKLFQ